MVKNCDYGKITTSSVIKQFLLENPPPIKSQKRLQVLDPPDSPIGFPGHSWWTAPKFSRGSRTLKLTFFCRKKTKHDLALTSQNGGWTLSETIGCQIHRTRVFYQQKVCIYIYITWWFVGNVWHILDVARNCGTNSRNWSSHTMPYPPICPKPLHSTAMWCSLTLSGMRVPVQFLLTSWLLAVFLCPFLLLPWSKQKDTKVNSRLSKRPHNHRVKWLIQYTLLEIIDFWIQTSI